MDRKDLEERTKGFALRVVRFVSDLPKNKVADVLGHQLLRSGTSIGANYREAARAESRNDFIHKIGVAEKEAAETEYCLEVLEGTGVGDAAERRWLRSEACELVAILTASGRTAKSNRPARSLRTSQSDMRNSSTRQSKPNSQSTIRDSK
jgi:four helix bundle protein